ncbi:MAG: hypothetical protein OS130_01615 [Thermodesulfobacteriota bacterium]|nr:MAG: hypothetical protein OS130_01615 [Thermodesulfobacteriota bacterium]
MNNQIDINKIVSPIIAAQLTSAYYCALISKQQNDVEVTAEVEHQALEEVLSRWRVLCRLFDDFLLGLKETSKPDQG